MLTLMTVKNSGNSGKVVGVATTELDLVLED